MTTRTYLATDWKLWTYQPQPGSFVLDFSQLNGTDVLGSVGGSLVEAPYEVANITINEGGVPSNGMFLPVTPSTLSVSFIVKDFTADVINSFYVGTSIYVTVKPYVSPGTTLNDVPMFQGTIDSADVLVIPGEDYSTLTVTAVSLAGPTLNTLLGVTKNETTQKGSLIQSAATSAGINIGVDAGVYHFKGTATESKSLGDWLTDLALCDLMQLRDSFTPVLYGVSGTDYIIYYNGYLRMNTTTVAESSAVGTISETDISNLELGWSGSDAPTAVNLTNYTDSTIIYTYGNTEATSVGATAYSATVDLKNLAEMTTVGQQFLAMIKKFTPVTITVPIARQYETVDYRATIVDPLVPGSPASWYLYPTNCYDLGDTIEIDLPDRGIENQKMIVTGRTTEVTPDNWNVTYNLWKGFTY